jgi:hypothetical protein
MRKLLSRFRSAILLALLAVTAFPHVAAACSIGFPLEAVVTVECGDRSLAIYAEKMGTEDRLVEHLDGLGGACETDLEESKRILTSEYQNWPKYGGGGSELTFVRWSADQEALLRERREQIDLADCFSAVEYRRVGDWLVYHPTQQPYCRNISAGNCCLCPDIRFSPTLFLLHTFRHPLRVLDHDDPATTPYLVTAATILVMLIGLMIILYRTRTRLNEVIRTHALPLGFMAMIVGVCIPIGSIFIWWPPLIPREAACLTFPLGVGCLILAAIVRQRSEPFATDR